MQACKRDNWQQPTSYCFLHFVQRPWKDSLGCWLPGTLLSLCWKGLHNFLPGGKATIEQDQHDQEGPGNPACFPSCPATACHPTLGETCQVFRKFFFYYICTSYLDWWFRWVLFDPRGFNSTGLELHVETGPDDLDAPARLWLHLRRCPAFPAGGLWRGWRQAVRLLGRGHQGFHDQGWKGFRELSIQRTIAGGVFGTSIRKLTMACAKVFLQDILLFSHCLQGPLCTKYWLLWLPWDSLWKQKYVMWCGSRLDLILIGINFKKSLLWEQNNKR